MIDEFGLSAAEGHEIAGIEEIPTKRNGRHQT